MAASMQRIEIVGERRRTHDAAFRARVVSEAWVAGTRVRDLARRHGICTSLIYRWRVASPEAGAGSAVRLLPVRITEPRGPEKRPAPVRASAPAARRSGLIEIELDGGVRVRVGRRGDRHAARLRWSRRPGRATTRPRPVQWAGLRLPRPSWPPSDIPHTVFAPRGSPIPGIRCSDRFCGSLRTDAARI